MLDLHNLKEEEKQDDKVFVATVLALKVKHTVSKSLPAFLVSTKNSAISKVWASTRPLPKAFTLLASPISDWPTMILKGLLATCMPSFLTLTSCSPTSLGVKEIPVNMKEAERKKENQD